MKRVSIVIFSVLFLLLALSYLVINSSFVVDRVSQSFLPKFHINYQEIKGNAVSGITLNRIFFNGNRLADSISIRINPLSLLHGKATISKLHFINVDKETLLEMIELLSNPKKESSKDKSFDLPIAVEVDDIKVTLKPFQESGVDIKRASLQVEFVELNQNGISIGELHSLLESSLGDMEVSASFEDGVLSINRVNLKRLKPLALLGVTQKNPKEPQKDIKNRTKKQNSSLEKFLPKELTLKELNIDIAPDNIFGVKLKEFLLSARDLRLDLQKKELKELKLTTKLKSSIGNLKSKIFANRDMLNIKALLVDNISIDEILRLLKSKSGQKTKKKGKEKGQDTTQALAILPKKILIGRAYIKALPTKIDKAEISDAKIFVESLLLNELKLKKGKLQAKLSSNLAYFQMVAQVKDEKLFLDRRENFLRLKDALFKEYKIDIKNRKISPIVFKGVVSQKGVKVYSALKAKFEVAKQKVVVKSAVSKLYGDFNSSNFSLDSMIKLSTNFTPETKIKSHINLKTQRYFAKIITPKVLPKDKNISKLIGRVELVAKGSNNTLVAKLKSRHIFAELNSRDMKRATLNLKTDKIFLKRYFSIPKELSNSYSYLKLNSNINLKKPTPLKANFKLLSNLVDTKGNILYEDDILIKATSTIPKNTLLKRFDKNLKLSNIGKITTELKKSKDRLNIYLNSNPITLKLSQNLKNSDLKVDILAFREGLALHGNLDKRVVGSMRIASIDRFIRNLSKIYRIENPNVDGKLELKLSIDKMKNIKLSLASKRIILNVNSRKKSYIDSIKATVSKEKEKIIIDNYSLKMEGMKLFATKASQILLKKERVELKEVWVNDSLKLTGNYNSKKSKGTIKAVAKSFKIEHKNLKAKAELNLRVKLNGKKSAVDGKITLLGGRINYKFKRKKYIKDSDIVVLQREKMKKDDNFYKNVKISLKIDTKKALEFKNREMRILLAPKLSVVKGFKDELQLLGTITLPKGGYYSFENKKFELQRSAIYFTGESENPMLDIRVVFKRYNRVIKIYIGGKASDPLLNFSSNPPMSREQILSYILFDDENAVNSANMVSALGGALAKSLLKNIGVKIDSMVIKSGGFEVGKRVSKKVTILYDQSDEPRAIIRIEHSHKFETDISVGEKSQSVDITFKKEF